MANKRDLLKLIRMNCAECMGGVRAIEGVWPIENPSDVNSCPAEKCGFWVYRMGRDPEKNPLYQEAARRNFGLPATAGRE